jgi:hypothetical protein
MGERLSGGNVALALLANTVATGAALVAFILAFGPISGAHFNPVVTVCNWWAGGVSRSDAVRYVPVQVFGGLVGVSAAHAMFGQAWLTMSPHVRSGGAQLLSEGIATFGLLCVIWGVSLIASRQGRCEPDRMGSRVASRGRAWDAPGEDETPVKSESPWLRDPPVTGSVVQRLSGCHRATFWLTLNDSNAGVVKLADARDSKSRGA